MADEILPLLKDVDLLVARALWPDASRKDIDALDAWIGNNAERALLVMRLQQARRALPVTPRHHRVDAAWKRMRVRLALAPRALPMAGAASRSMRLPVRGGGRATLVGLAAAVLLFVAGWQLSGGRMWGRAGASGVMYTTYSTANGQRATITLADGNTVVLNVASRLEVPMNYGTGNHVVRLPVGEALFTVSHHAGAPFTVIAGSTTTHVLGTSFVVRRYPTDTAATVVVAEGKVSVGPAVVTAQHLVEIGSDGLPRLRAADPSRFAFATGVLALDSMPLVRALPELDRWYDADIRLGDPTLAKQVVEGKVTAGSLADLATILEWTFNIHVVRDGRVLTLYPESRR